MVERRVNDGQIGAPWPGTVPARNLRCIKWVSRFEGMATVLFKAVWTKMSFRFSFRQYAIIVLKGVSEGRWTAWSGHVA